MTVGRRSVLAGGVAALIPGSLFPGVLWGGARAEESAAAMVAQECELAAQEGKRVLLVFYASWCTWCHAMDAMLEDAQAAALLDPHFRVVHLRAGEHDADQQALQLPGADDVYDRYTGTPQGLPFTAVLDAEARAVTTSISTINGENFGFPVTDEELDGFEAMLAIAAPAMSAEDRAALRAAAVRALG